jgi:predicted small secreted protein
MVKKVLLAVALIIVAFTLIGCQTVAGFGEDISWTAEATAEMLEGN